MPELPEVETMVRGLRPALAGRRLRRLEVRDPFLLQGCSAAELARRGRGATVVDVTRRGKWVVLELGDHRGIIVIQPRMTGGFWLVDPLRPDHIRLAFHLDKPRATVWYCDTRRLGKICWYADARDAARAVAHAHGPDALEIGRDQLAAQLARTARGIKPALMDQKVLAGIGNIYADEVLFRARIHPERPAATLSAQELDRLHQAIGEILNTAIALEGSSFDAGYRTVLGLEGGFLAQNAVYGRDNLPCQACQRPIVKTRIAGLIGRPTYYCPGCQARERRDRAPTLPISFRAPADRGRPRGSRHRTCHQAAAKNGLAVAPRDQWDHLLWAKFDGDIFEINQTIAYYDEDDDELVIHQAHAAWADLREYVQAEQRQGHFSTRAPDHIVGHEIGHALHYRGMTDAERAEIWYTRLTRDEEAISEEVSRYATHGRIEFVAQVYFGLWSRRKFSSEVLALSRDLKGPWR